MKSRKYRVKNDNGDQAFILTPSKIIANDDQYANQKTILYKYNNDRSSI
jgi:hypothetical protein